jgi:hypothetical protein
VPTLKFRSGGYEISLITKVRNWQEAPKKNKSNIKQGVKYFLGLAQTLRYLLQNVLSAREQILSGSRATTLLHRKSA